MTDPACIKFQGKGFEPAGGIKRISIARFIAKFFEIFGAHKKSAAHEARVVLFKWNVQIHRDCPFNFVIEFQSIKGAMKLSLVKKWGIYK